MKNTFFYISIIATFLSCSARKSFVWVDTQENVKLWVEESQSSYSFSWNGGNIEGVANGIGTLVIIQNGQVIDSSKQNIYYGAIDNDGIEKISPSETYIGETESKKYSGFGVLIKQQEVLIGHFVKSKANGYCSYFRDGKIVYRGMWKKHQLHGEGIQYTQDDTISGIWDKGKLVRAKLSKDTKVGRFSGYIENNLPNGQGSMEYFNGWNYTGNWKNGLWNGEGTLKNDSISYVGTWIDNCPNGEGVLSFSNQSYYDGYWENGKRNGWGDCKFSNGDYYIGEWRNNMFDGIGCYIFNSGSEYNGNWKDGLQHGYGIYKTDSVTYSGDWEQGLMHGEGCLEYNNGKKYVGTLKCNKFEGNGTYVFENGNIYEGEFSDNVFNGLGIFYFQDGSIYEGEFENGNIFGDGTYTYIGEGDTIAITAQWMGNSEFPKQASICFSNGDIYEGEIINGKPTSNGCWYTISQKIGILEKSNEIFKRHEEAFNAAIFAASLAVSTVGIVQPALAPVAELINIGINCIDIGFHISSAMIDKDYSAAAVEIGINVALIAVPAIYRKATTKAAKPIAKTFVRESSISLAKNTEKQGFKKVIKVGRDSNGGFKKSLEKSTTKNPKTAQKAYRDLAPKLANTKLAKELKAIEAKGPIKLSQKELQALLDNPKDNIRAFIRAKTGDHKNYKEFFIRLTMGSKEQTKQLLENPDIRKYVDRSIRRSGEGAVHEWLMTKNFQDFLLNPKWGKDGPYLAYALDKFVQKTKNVRFKTGGGHPSDITPNTSESAQFHNRLAELIENCSSKEELFIAIKRFAKQELDKESYAEFCKIFKEIFLTQ